MSSMTVSEILAALQRQGVTVNPRGISADSRRIAEGSLFVALPGVRGDGRDYIEDALQRGAAAVIWESAAAGDCAARLDKVPNVPVDGLQAVLGALADEVHGRPSMQMWVCGITGTNGKTTVSQWIAQALNMLGRRCGVIGTLGNGLPGALVDSANTTPDVISVHATLAGLRDAGATACAMEVSSIGLDQRRVDGVRFDTVIFTNLTRDHLEYHGNIINYGAAKARLFELPGIRNAIFNLDDPLGAALADNLAGRSVRRIGYTLDEHCPHAASVDELLVARDLQVGGHGFSFRLASTAGEMSISAALLGRFNVSNLLAVFAALLAADVEPAAAAASCAQLTSPPGRLQIVNTDADGDAPLLVVDYAHTPDALEQVLTTLREVATARAGRLLCVFGCGGERDSGKRPLMGRVVERFADEVVVTSDNPRGEDPQAIISAILDGMTTVANCGTAVTSEVDRTVAIADTVRRMQPQDVLLIAGKGHESYQEIAGQRLPYSDLEQAQLALAAWSAEAC